MKEATPQVLTFINFTSKPLLYNFETTVKGNAKNCASLPCTIAIKISGLFHTLISILYSFPKAFVSIILRTGKTGGAFGAPTYICSTANTFNVKNKLKNKTLNFFI